MQLALQRSGPSGTNVRRNSNLFLALVFWAFTYVLFTYRANLRYGDAYELLAIDRVVSTFIGAALYWLVLTRLIDGARNRPEKPLAVIATILPASIIILLVRVLLDQFNLGGPNGFAGDLRFVSVWGGYFGLWVSASFALRVMPRVNFKAELIADPSLRRQNGNGIARAEMLERLALEVASLPAAERKALLESFAMPIRYETADELEPRTRTS